MTTFKAFSNEQPKVTSPSSGVFTYDDAWSMSVQGVFSIKEKDLKKKRWNKAVWEGADLQDATIPGKAVYLLDVQVGRGRRHRYTVTDGETWCDVHGLKRDSSLKRGWATEVGPWKLVESTKARPLNMAAKAVITNAINYFMSNQAKGK
jgi:hypothetical protein